MYVYMCERYRNTTDRLFHECGTACLNVLYSLYGHISILHTLNIQ